MLVVFFIELFICSVWKTFWRTPTNQPSSRLRWFCWCLLWSDPVEYACSNDHVACLGVWGRGIFEKCTCAHISKGRLVGFYIKSMHVCRKTGKSVRSSVCSCDQLNMHPSTRPSVYTPQHIYDNKQQLLLTFRPFGGNAHKMFCGCKSWIFQALLHPLRK